MKDLFDDTNVIDMVFGEAEKPSRPADIIFPEAKKVKDLGGCPTCGKPVKDEDFKDEMSKREHKISGMCQECQDKVFK